MSEIVSMNLLEYFNYIFDEIKRQAELCSIHYEEDEVEIPPFKLVLDKFVCLVPSEDYTEIDFGEFHFISPDERNKIGKLIEFMDYTDYASNMVSEVVIKNIKFSDNVSTLYFPIWLPWHTTKLTIENIDFNNVRNLIGPFHRTRVHGFLRHLIIDNVKGEIHSMTDTFKDCCYET